MNFESTMEDIFYEIFPPQEYFLRQFHLEKNQQLMQVQREIAENQMIHFKIR